MFEVVILIMCIVNGLLSTQIISCNFSLKLRCRGKCSVWMVLWLLHLKHWSSATGRIPVSNNIWWTMNHRAICWEGLASESDNHRSSSNGVLKTERHTKVGTKYRPSLFSKIMIS